MQTSLLKTANENPLVVGLGVLGSVVAGVVVMRKSSMNRNSKDYDSQFTGAGKILNNEDHTLKGNEFSSSINDYEGMFSGARKTTGAITEEESIAVRTERYAAMINHFYNLVTDFYEWGWGQSFHFGPRFHDESFVESIKRAEYHLCSRLGMKPGMIALDVGCGVGGPMRNMCVFSGSQIEGITINEYQVKVGNKYNVSHGLDSLCKLNRGDFQELPWPENHFDVAYAIEATCHSPNRTQTFAGVARVLKPGGLFASYEWIMTPKYDKTNKDHIRIKEGIEVGNGLPTLTSGAHVLDCMTRAGFESLPGSIGLFDSYDANRGVHAKNELPWYETLNGKMSISGFRMTHMGRMITHSMVWTLELLRLAPEGTTKVSQLLNDTAIDLCDGGKLEIFTPSFFFIGRKKAGWKMPSNLEKSPLE